MPIDRRENVVKAGEGKVLEVRGWDQGLNRRHRFASLTLASLSPLSLLLLPPPLATLALASRSRPSPPALRHRAHSHSHARAPKNNPVVDEECETDGGAAPDDPACRDNDPL